MGFPGSSDGKNLPAMQETWLWSLGQEDPLEKEMATLSNILAWRVPRTEAPSGLQPTGWQSWTRLRWQHACALCQGYSTEQGWQDFSTQSLESICLSFSRLKTPRLPALTVIQSPRNRMTSRFLRLIDESRGHPHHICVIRLVPMADGHTLSSWNYVCLWIFIF